jgi:hypothetical protein
VVFIVIGSVITIGLLVTDQKEFKDADKRDGNIDTSKAELIPWFKQEPPSEITKKGWHKVTLILEIVTDPIIQNALKSSNEEFSKMSPSILEKHMETKEKEWISAIKPTPFMNSVMNNHVADFLIERTLISSDEFGDIVFGEHILSNSKGANVAVTVRTDNYDQSNDDWWSLANNVGLLIRECDWDESAQMFSQDIVIRIHDENDEFLGIMNSATPCDVLEEEFSEVTLDYIF